MNAQFTTHLNNLQDRALLFRSIGALVSVIGFFLPWFKYTQDAQWWYSGWEPIFYDNTSGTALVCGLIFVVYAVLLFATMRTQAATGIAILSIVVVLATLAVVMLAFAVAGGMGMGDVKLAGVLGLSAGLVSATAAVVSPLVAFVLGGIAAIGALRGGRGASIPFGPFLLAGFWVAVVVG